MAEEDPRFGLTRTWAETDEISLVPRTILSESGLARGAALGRYIVLECLGAGAMGIVFAAYDPELDRRVAVKVLHARGSSDASAGRARLLREAQAMARLSHPNVVTVHDVGTFEGDLIEGDGLPRVFVAMEFVDGITLNQWLGERPRAWREILEVLVPVARALHAIHEGGVVHRDVKPDNIMVGRDGRVRLMDLGLARPVELGRAPAVRAGDAEATASLSQPRDNSNGGRAPIGLVTRRGAIAGTPAYMAPEQAAHGRGGVSPRRATERRGEVHRRGGLAHGGVRRRAVEPTRAHRDRCRESARVHRGCERGAPRRRALVGAHRRSRARADGAGDGGACEPAEQLGQPPRGARGLPEGARAPRAGDRDRDDAARVGSSSRREVSRQPRAGRFAARPPAGGHRARQRGTACGSRGARPRSSVRRHRAQQRVQRDLCDRGRGRGGRVLHRTLAEHERALGPDHFQVAPTLNNIGAMLHLQGRDEEAYSYLSRARKVFDVAYPADHPQVAGLELNLGTCALALRRTEEAIEHLRRALEVRVKTLGDDHETVAEARTELAAALAASGRLAEALAELEMALTIGAHGAVPDDPFIARIRAQRGLVWAAMGSGKAMLAERELAWALETIGADAGGELVDRARLALARLRSAGHRSE